jgi:hypothetical protein
MMGEHLEKIVHNEKFITEMSKSIAATMTGKAFYTKAMDEQMAAMHLPSRTEMVKVLQKLTDIEERLIDLGERFEDYVEEQAKVKTTVTQPQSAAATKEEQPAQAGKKSSKKQAKK